MIEKGGCGLYVLIPRIIIHIASFPSLLRSFCPSVGVDDNARMWKSGEERERPSIIHHVSDVRWSGGPV